MEGMGAAQTCCILSAIVGACGMYVIITQPMFGKCPSCRCVSWRVPKTICRFRLHPRRSMRFHQARSSKMNSFFGLIPRYERRTESSKAEKGSEQECNHALTPLHWLDHSFVPVRSDRSLQGECATWFATVKDVQSDRCDWGTASSGDDTEIFDYGSCEQCL